MNEPLHLAISPCPNDTFAFAGLLEEESDPRGLALRFELIDVQASNARLARGELDAGKASFHAALHLTRDTAVLSAGAALGYGVGPLLLARPGAPPLGPAARVLCPGAWTTATLLFQLFHAPATPEQVVFSEILPALAAGRADYGVCIHEGRFTWREHGLELVEDLGLRWEQAFDCALPLGGILYRKRGGEERARRLAEAIEASIAWSRAHPERAARVMRRHAQELSPEVLDAHVALYVNADTLCLSHPARAALARLSREAERLGLVAAGAPALEVWGRREPARVFHLAPPDAARAWLAPGGTWRPSSLAEQGFVHLSFAEQLAGTLALHHGAFDELALVELDPARAGTALVHEPSRGGALFPHLRRELQAGDALRRWSLRRGPRGWDLPVLGARPDADAPPGDPTA